MQSENQLVATTPPVRKKGRPFGTKKKGPPLIWAPQPKQAEALVRTEFEVLYGGARGGGKSAAGRAWLLYPQMEYGLKKVYEWELKKYRALVIRLNAKDLSDWLDKAREVYLPLGAIFKGSPTEIHFPKGWVIRTGHLKDENAYTQYQGHEYQRILIEELTQIPEERYYEQLISSCRSTIPTIKPQVFCTTNPGNIGHDWVKSRWGIEGTPKDIIFKKTSMGDRVFVPASVYDNPTLTETDPNYVRQLESISDLNLKRAWLYGDWNDPVIEGQIYKDEITNAQSRITNVPFDPRHPVYTYWDIGVGDATVIGFFQFIGGASRWIDYYENSGKGISFYRNILDAKGYFYGGHFGPHDLAQRHISGGEVAETVVQIAEQLGIHFIVLPRQGIQEGITKVKEKFSLLWIDEIKCSQGIKALKYYRREYDDDKKVYKDTPVHDWASHAADMIRIWAMAPEPMLYGQMEQNFNLYGTTYT